MIFIFLDINFRWGKILEFFAKILAVLWVQKKLVVNKCNVINLYTYINYKHCYDVKVGKEESSILTCNERCEKRWSTKGMSSILDIFELTGVRMPIYTSTNAVICFIMQLIEIVFFFPRKNFSFILTRN